MAKIRDTHLIFDAVASDNDGVRSTASEVGERTNVALFIENSGSDSVVIAVHAAPGTGTPGRNAVPAEGDWHALLEDDLATPIGTTVASGAKVALNLSPFAPYWISLLATSAVADTPGEITAYIQSVL